ncbi:unnamed protein product, partial [Brassica oleracea]
LFLSLSLSFVTSSLFFLQYREHDIFSGDFDLHFHHPISITPLLWRFRSSSSSSNLDHSIFSVRIERRICFVWRRSMTQDQSFWSGTEMGLIRLDKSVFSHSMTPGETISVSSASIKGAMAFEMSLLILYHFFSCSYEELVNRNRDQSVSDYIVMFFWFVTAGEFCKTSIRFGIKWNLVLWFVLVAVK